MSDMTVFFKIGRWSLRLAIGVAIPLVLLFTALLVLLATRQGSSWVLTAAQRAEPRFSATLEAGTLLHGATLRGVRWDSSRISLRLSLLEWRWRWSCLVERTLCVEHLLIRGGKVVLTETDEAKSSPRDSGTDDSHVKLPFALQIDSLQLEESEFTLHGQHVEVEALQGTGRLALEEGYPLSLNAQGQLHLPPHPETIALHLSASGSLAELDLDLASDAPFSIQLLGRINLLAPDLTFAGRLNWQDFRWPLEQPNLRSAAGELELSGSISAQTALQGDGAFRLPVTGTVKVLRLQSTELNLSGNSFRLAGLRGDARLAPEGLRIKPLQLQGLQIILAATESTATTAPASLPMVSLPLAIDLDDLELINGQIEQGVHRYQLDRLGLSARMSGSDLELRRFALVAPQADLQGNGQIALRDGYPVTLTTEGTLHEVPQFGDIGVRLATSGSLSDLGLAVTTSGPVTAQLSAQVKPLEPDLPFAAVLNWQDLHWPLKEPTLFSPTGQLEIDGALPGYNFRLVGEVVGEHLPELTLTVRGKGDLNQLGQISANVETLGGSLAVDGSLSWEDQLAWQGRLTCREVEPGMLISGLPGRLSGRANSALHRSVSGAWQLKLEQLLLAGELKGWPLQLEGDLQYNSGGEWLLSQLQLRSAGNRLQVDGRIGRQSQLQGSVEIKDLGGSIAGTGGTAQGEFTLSGPQDGLTLEIRLKGQDLAYAARQIGALTIEGQLTSGENRTAFLRLQGEDLHWNKLRFEQVAAEFSGNDKHHLVGLELLGEKYAARSLISGSLLNRLWSGELQEGWLETPLGQWLPDLPFSFGYDLKTRSVAISDHCWRSETASFCLDEPLQAGASGQINLSLREFSLTRITDLLPQGIFWQGTLEGRAVTEWTPDSPPELEFSLSAGPGRVAVDQAGQKVQSDYQQLELNGLITPQGGNAELTLRSHMLGRGDVRLQLLPAAGEPRVSGEFHLTNLQLALLRPFIAPLDEISGSLDADGTVDGPLKRPQLTGTISLRDGHLDGAKLATEVEQLNALLKLENDQAMLQGDLNLGKGRAELAGVFNWQHTPMTGWMTLKGQQNRYRLDPELNLLLNPDLRLEMHPGRLELSGTVAIPYGRAKIKSLPKTAVPLSQDVVILDTPEPSRIKQTQQFSMGLEIQLRDDVAIEAFGLKSHLDGTLALNRAPTQPLTGNGSIDLRGGTYRAFGQNLLINRGMLLFAGPLSKPFIDIDAIRSPDSTSDGVIAGIRLRGPAQNPKITIYSEPAMAQQEAISYLLRGRSLEAGSASSQDTMVANMLLGAGISGSGRTISEFGEALGIEELAVETRSSGEETQARVSGYLLPGVQVGYGFGIFTPITELTLRYEILPKLILEAIEGLQSSIDLLYQFEF
ncbi:MAG: translocation/assembly module TamB domain-containing protein [Desulfuromonadales bacterium]|nr:translocation/assembly module TamB domain-containing protein [Desulfuromonadales bacterium]